VRDSLIGAIDSSQLLLRDEEQTLWPLELNADPATNSMLWVDEISCIGARRLLVVVQQLPCLFVLSSEHRGAQCLLILN